MKSWAKVFVVALLVDVVISFALGCTLGNSSRDIWEVCFVGLLFIWGGGIFYYVKSSLSWFLARKILKNEFEGGYL